MAKSLAIQAQCAEGAGGRGKMSDSGMPSRSVVSELREEKGWRCFQGRVKTPGRGGQVSGS